MKLRTSDGITITIEQQPFAKGGEGTVHKIVAPASHLNFCAKLYLPKVINAEKQQKIEYMVTNPPPEKVTENQIICWPQAVLFGEEKFVGFIMPLAFDDSILLYELCRPKLNRKHHQRWHKFNRNTKQGFEARLKLCTNLAIAIHRIHSLQNYVLVDFKPQNALVTNDGKISMLDCDSVQISKENKVIFPALVATPEYVPPESERLNPSKDKIHPSWDRFAMAIVFYEIMFGLHPFAATFGGEFIDINTLPGRIRVGLFAHGKHKKHLISLPPPHTTFNHIPHNLKALFWDAFDDDDIRPSAEKWGQGIFKELAAGIKLPLPKVVPTKALVKSTKPEVKLVKKQPTGVQPQKSQINLKKNQPRGIQLLQTQTGSAFMASAAFTFVGALAFGMEGAIAGLFGMVLVVLTSGLKNL